MRAPVWLSPADVAALARATFRPERPDRLARAMLAIGRAGPTLNGIAAGAVARYPDAPAVIDPAGSRSFAELWRDSDAVALELQRRGVAEGTTVGLLARNHRGFVTSMLGASKLGADLVFLNTGFAGPQLADVVAHEGIEALLYDAELTGIVQAADVDVALSSDDMAALARAGPTGRLSPSRRQSGIVILTSGTTGRPKGARRSGSAGAGSLSGLLRVMPLRARDTVVIAAPLFHAWGLSHLSLGLGLSSTAVVEPHFDPERTLAMVAEHRADGLVVVPVMLQRILALDERTRARYDTSSLRYVASSGSALGATLSTAVIEQFGPILYNVYGSTEVSVATIATPDDLQRAPATAGRPAPGSAVQVLGERGEPLPPGELGRIFVGSGAAFEGYTGGGTKEAVGGLLSSGDVGHFDDDGLLFVDGRDDDMIVSGGENVFPGEVEDLLRAHPSIADAAVIGVDDEEFGQALKAFVIRKPGASLKIAEVRHHVRAELARYKVPREVVFVDELPRTTTGKVRRQDLGR